MKDRLENLLMELAPEYEKYAEPNILYTKLQLTGHLTSNECDLIEMKKFASAKILVSSVR